MLSVDILKAEAAEIEAELAKRKRLALLRELIQTYAVEKGPRNLFDPPVPLASKRFASMGITDAIRKAICLSVGCCAVPA